MNEKSQSLSQRWANKPKRKWFAIAGLCVVACKLPLILALIGIGGIGTGASLFGIGQVASNGAIIIGLSLILIIAAYFLYRAYRRPDL